MIRCYKILQHSGKINIMSSSPVSERFAPTSESSYSWHNLVVEKALELLQSDRASGLQTPQVTERLQRYGPNELIETGGRSSWDILIDQFSTLR